jgi:hypothetical protein
MGTIYSKLKINDIHIWWEQIRTICEEQIDQLENDSSFIESAFIAAHRCLFIIDNIRHYKKKYSNLVNKHDDVLGYRFPLIPKDLRKDEFETSKDFEERIKELEGRLHNDLDKFEEEVKPLIINYFERISNCISMLKEYNVEIVKYYADQEDLQIRIRLPECFCRREENDRLGDSFPYRPKIPLGRPITKYNYFVKISHDIAKESVENIRGGKYLFSISFRFVDMDMLGKGKTATKKISQYIKDYFSEVKNRETGHGPLSNLKLAIDQLKLIDTETNRSFSKYNEGDHHKRINPFR